MLGIRNARAAGRRFGWRGAAALLLGAGGVAGGSVLLFGGSAVGAPTCTINFNTVAGGDFFNAGNWNDAVTAAHRVPGTSDYACVPATTTGPVTFSTGTSKTIKGIDAEGTGGFAVGAGTLTLSDVANATTMKNLDFFGGATIAGAGAVNLTGTGTWESGTFSGTGAVTVASGATVSVTSTGCYPLLTKALTNHGTIAISDGGCSGLYVGASKTLTNASDGTIDFKADTAQIGNYDSSAVSIANSGTVKKTVGSGTSTVNVPVTNSGASVSYQATTGTIALTTSNNAATIGGSGFLDLGSAFNVTGATSISSGPSVQMNGTVVDGAGNLTFNGSVTWNYGTMQGAGNTTVGTTGVLSAPSGNCYPLLTRSLTNHGTFSITNGTCGGVYVGSAAVLTNASDGTIDFQGDSTGILSWDSTGQTITNSGVIKRSAGSGTSIIGIDLTSSSTNGLQAQVGTLSLQAGGTISGSTSTSASATLGLDNSTIFAVNGATFGGAGTTRVQGSTVNLTGTTTVSSPFLFDGGTIDGAGALALNGGGTWNYGTMQGAGATTIAAATTVSMPSANCYPLVMRPLTNHGTLTLSNAGCSGMYVGNSAVVTNASDGTIDLQGAGTSINTWDNSATLLSNAGVIKRSTGSGSSTIGIPVNSSSTNGLQVQAGTLSLTVDSTISGSTSVSAGATLGLDNSAIFAVNGASFGGAGTTRVQGSTVNLTGTTTIGSVFLFDGGTIDGAGALALNGGGTWNYGTMQGAGATTIAAATGISMPSASCYPLVARPLTNHGTLTLVNGGCGLYLSSAIVLTNASDGVIDLQGTAGITDYDSSSPTISNAGVIKHSTGNVTSTIGPAVTNTGVGELRADAGTFVITALGNVSGNTVTGGAYTATGSGNLQLPIGGTGKLLTNAAAISLSGANSKISSPSLANALVSIATSSGSLSLTNGRLLSTNAASFANSGTVVIGDGITASTLTVGGPYTQSAGTTTVTTGSTLTPTASTVTISGGTLNGAGTVSRPVATSGTGTVQNAAATPLTLASGYSGSGKVKAAITSASVFDQINVTGTATVTGSTLALSTDPGYVPVTGQTFTILSCTTACTGPFSSVTGATMNDGAFYVVSYPGTSVVLTVVRNADVSITNTDSADPIKADAPAGPHTSLTYTVTVANAGPGPANGVTLTDTLPHHVFATSVPGSCTGSGDVKTCSLGTIASGSNVVLAFVVKPVSPEAITNTASSTSTTPDPNSANNTGISQSTVVQAALNTSYVNVDDGAGGVSYDKPAVTLKKQGNKLQFNFFGTASHRLLSDEGTIDTGVQAPGASFAVAITGSGIYSYHDTLAAQVVTGKVTVKPTFTGTGSTRTVTWASAPPAAGHVFDVKVSTPTGLVTLFTGTTSTSTSFTATQGPGTYQFQVRSRRTSDNKATGYAKSLTFTI